MFQKQSNYQVIVVRVLRLGRIAHWQGDTSFDSLYFPVLAQDILGKGELLVAPPLADCLTGLTGSSTQGRPPGTDLTWYYKVPYIICFCPFIFQRLSNKFWLLVLESNQVFFSLLTFVVQHSNRPIETSKAPITIKVMPTIELTSPDIL